MIAKEIQQNCHEAILSLIEILLNETCTIDTKFYEQMVAFSELGKSIPENFDNSYMEIVNQIWNDPDIQRCYRERNTLNFFDNVKRYVLKTH